MEDKYYDLALMERIGTAEMPLIDSSDIYWEVKLDREDETNLGTDNERGASEYIEFERVVKPIKVRDEK